MTLSEIREHRLINQQIGRTSFTKPQEIVSWLVAMQAQEYAMAKWAIGLRLPGFTDPEIEDLFNKGEILRTHVMRPTWHFVSPADIRWLLKLTSPRVHAFSNPYYKKTSLDAKTFKKCHDLFERELQGGKHLTREQLQTSLAKVRITAKGMRLAYIMMNAELEGLICSGPRVGKQFTYALLEERAPKVKSVDRDEALGKLMNRYFASRGPATLNDFAWWSGLTMKDARSGVEMLDKGFEREIIKDKEYIFKPVDNQEGKLQSTFLMPDYDEYGISYKDRSAYMDEKLMRQDQIPKATNPHFIIIDGVFAGCWKLISKTSGRNKMQVLELYLSKPLSKSKQAMLNKAGDRYLAFMRT